MWLTPGNDPKELPVRERLMALLAAVFLALCLSPGAAAATSASAGSAPDGFGPPAASTLPTGAQEETGEGLRGTLRGPDRQPLVGVTVTVSRDGAEIGTGTSDDAGQWEVALPGPGSYTATLDVAGLPEGVVPRTEGAETVEGVTVRPGATQGVIFQLAAAGDDGQAPPPSDGGGAAGLTGRVLQLVVEGIKVGAIIAITAVGLSLVFGTTRLINFAHGDYVTIGAVAAYFFSVGSGPLPLLVAAILAMVVTALVAGGVELAIWRPMRRRGTGLIQMFIVAIGLSLLLRHAVLVVYGPARGQYDQFTLQQSWDLGLFRITPRDLVVTVLALTIMVLVAVMLQRTRIGKAMRAVNDNRDLALASGVDVDRVVMVVWLLGGALAGLGGVFLGLTQAVFAEMGFNLLLLMFAAVILGGLGNAYGAMLGALVIGIVSQLSTLWFPSSLQNMWALLIMILVLLLRPQGILGRRERVG